MCGSRLALPSFDRADLLIIYHMVIVPSSNIISTRLPNPILNISFHPMPSSIISLNWRPWRFQNIRKLLKALALKKIFIKRHVCFEFLLFEFVFHLLSEIEFKNDRVFRDSKVRGVDQILSGQMFEEVDFVLRNAFRFVFRAFWGGARSVVASCIFANVLLKSF